MATPGSRLAAVIDASTRWVAFDHLERTTSTNDVALARAGEGRLGYVVAADHQTAGRGRRGRDWQDRPGGSLLVSVSVPPPVDHVSLVPLAAGLALADAVGRTGAAARLKWPNDVLVDLDGWRKCAGILVERRAVGDAAVVLIGMGTNVDWRGQPGEATGWGSVAAAAGRDVDRWDLLADLLDALDIRLDQLERDAPALVADYRDRCLTLGQDVEVVVPGDDVVGRAVDVDHDGALVLDRGDGRRIRITAGDVTHLVRRVP